MSRQWIDYPPNDAGKPTAKVYQSVRKARRDHPCNGDPAHIIQKDELYLCAHVKENPDFDGPCPPVYEKQRLCRLCACGQIERFEQGQVS